MDDLLEFFRDIHSLKHRERQGWKDIGVEKPRDTIASHSFGAALIGWSLAEKQGIDQEKILKMLLMHDLIMSYIPDYTPRDEGFNSKKEEENRKFEKLIQDVPDSISQEFRNLFREFQEEDTEASKLAHESDKLDTLLQARKYSEELEKDHLTEFLETYEDRFKSETGRKILEELKAENPGKK